MIIFNQVCQRMMWIIIVVTLFSYTSTQATDNLPNSLLITGHPAIQANPPSTVLPPNTTELPLTITTEASTSCFYEWNNEQGALSSNADGNHHTAILRNLNPAPTAINQVTMTCEAYADAPFTLMYRSLPNVNPSYPRTGNLWGSWEWIENGRSLEYMAQVDLWLGANGFTADEMRELRRLNPNIMFLSSANAVEWNPEWYDGEIPEDYWLRDVDGNRVEVWPGSYRLNLTKPEVAELVAYSIYEEHLEYEMQFDGVFIDNVFLSQSWQNEDIFGNTFPIDANEDGIADDPDTFDEAWRAGVLYELEVLRELMPHAIFSGHAMDINDPEIAAIFNGISFGFSVPEIIEGQTEFNIFWQRYNAWMTEAQSPRINMIESAVPYQIGYGYGYLPHLDMPRETWDFARDYYPYMRFGLSLTLMQDGYFAHEIGDTYHGNDWWYDELNFDLGYPLGQAEFIIPSGFSPQTVYQDNFIGDALENWSFWVDTDNGYNAAVNSEDGTARIDIASTTGQDWRVELSRHGRELVAGQTYELTFRARASDPRSITLSSQKDNPDWRNFGLYSQVQLQTTWQTHQLRFTATETTSQARIQFLVGASEGTVWIDDVSLVTTAPDLLRRDFDNGIVLLNATIAPQVIDIPVGYRRLTGTQASMAEYIVDDTPDTFITVGDWQSVVYDTDIWVATPPYYHDWGDGSHLGINGGAQWDLNIPFADTYTITAWLPATPDATNWNSNALYEVVSDGVVVASVTLDQRTANDTWQFLAEVPLKPDAFIRLNCDASAPCLADAFHVRSASRYHNGETVSQVTLQPMDGIILERIP